MCGENEIRTRDTLQEYTRFPGVPLQPLEHLSLQLPTREKTLHKNRKQQKAAFQRRDRDSNPGYLAVQRFSRPPQSTTLPPLQNFFSEVLFVKSGAKVRRYFKHARVFTKKTIEGFQKIAISRYFMLKSIKQGIFMPII